MKVNYSKQGWAKSEQLRLVAEMPVMLIAYDKNLRCLFASRRFAEFFGLASVSIAGKHLREIIGEVPYQEVKPYFDRVLEGHCAIYRRTRVLDSGELRDLEVELVPDIGQDGRTWALFSVTTDVTERKQAEAALREQEEFFRLIAENIDDFIAVLDLDGRRLYNSPSYRRFFDDTTDLHGTNSFAEVHPEDRQRVEQIFRETVRRGMGHQIEYRFMAKGDEIRNMESRGSVIRNKEGRVARVVVVSQDITERKRAEAALRAQEEFFRLIAENIGDFIAVLDLDGRRLYNSPSYRRFFGGTSELRGTNSFADVHPEDRQRVEQVFRATVQSGIGQQIEYRFVSQDGEIRHMESRGAVIRDNDGRVARVVVVSQDITERKRAEQALRDSAEKLRLFAENVPAMAASYDENLRCRFANKAFAEFFGFTVENLLGKHVRELYGEGVYPEIEGSFVQVLQGHPVIYQRTHKLPNGELRYLDVKLLPQIGDQGKILGCFAVTTDITQYKLAEERIQRMAHHDSLTGLPNRLLFNDRLEQAISLAKRNSRQFTLLYLDLDRFKPVNDTLGHAAGDELLQAVAARIRQQVRESDTVARVGGDEFTVILPDIARREEVETVAKKIVASLAAPFPLDSQKQSVEIGTSIGIAIYPADARDADALLRAADAAMYSAKQIGSSFRFCGT